MEPLRIASRLACSAALVALAGCAAAPDRPPPPAAAPVEVVAPAPVPAASPVALQAVERARGLLGAPYRFGGADPAAGFDCSGLVHFVFGESGVRLPRTAESQQGAVPPVGRDALLPGDLVFFRLPEPHVGIYAGGGEFIHAPGRGRGVEVARLREPWYQLAFAGAGRVAGPGPEVDAPVLALP